jgi:NDP-sugar pyrophosphorylase family protein
MDTNTMSSVQAFILLGGLGTRLRTLYPDRPKALVPILGRPFIAWQLTWLRSAGIRSVHLAAGHMASAIAAWMGSDEPENISVTLSEEPEPLGTGGGLKHIENHIHTNPFIVVNGDSLLPNLDWHGFLDAHRRSNAMATLAVARIEQTGRYGTVEFDKDHVITAFLEKTERPSGWINGGVYIVNRETLGHIPAGRTLSLETDVFPTLCRQGSLRVYEATAPILDMGTPEGIEQMETFLSAHGG